ncbi:MAG: SDR family oxidoreductase [Chloroflexi bacterium]|nr:SDR family oxidoreductase [Chloroflexota bacterium]
MARIADFSLTGRVAIVTGGSRGIGRSIALALAEAGADVAVAARKRPDLDQVVKEIEARGRQALPVECNVREREHLENLVKATTDRFGRLDIVVNNAGTNPTFGPIVDMEERAWDVVMNTNLKAAFLLSQAAARTMKERGGGSIINVASTGGLRASKGLGAYSVSKAGLIMLTRVLAAELGQYKIRVNAIAPAIIRTRFSEHLWKTPEIYEPAVKGTPLGRIGEPDETAGAVVFLASDAASYISGVVIPQDGGAGA